MDMLRATKKQYACRLIVSLLIVWLLSSGTVLAGEVYGTYSLVKKESYNVYNKVYTSYDLKWEKNNDMVINPSYTLIKKVDKQGRYVVRIDYKDTPEYLAAHPAVDQNNKQKVAYKLIKQGKKIRLAHDDRDHDDFQKVYVSKNILISDE